MIEGNRLVNRDNTLGVTAIPVPGVYINQPHGVIDLPKEDADRAYQSIIKKVVGVVNGDTKIEAGDILVLFGSSKDIQRILEM